VISLKIRAIVDGRAKGEVIFSSQGIAFLQGVDPETGSVSDPKSPIYNQSFAGKILVFPNTVGSSVGAYVIYRLKKNRKAPKAIVNQTSDIITASGCAIAGIPLFDLPENDISELSQAKFVSLDSATSELEIEK
jgi:phosphomecalonate degydratase small subunit